MNKQEQLLDNIEEQVEVYMTELENFINYCIGQVVDNKDIDVEKTTEFISAVHDAFTDAILFRSLLMAVNTVDKTDKQKAKDDLFETLTTLAAGYAAIDEDDEVEVC